MSNIITEDQILYEIGNYWVTTMFYGTGRFKPKSQGYAVWKTGITHSVQVGTIGFAGEDGLQRAKAEADRRNAGDLKLS